MDRQIPDRLDEIFRRLHDHAAGIGLEKAAPFLESVIITETPMLARRAWQSFSLYFPDDAQDLWEREESPDSGVTISPLNRSAIRELFH